MTAIQEIRDALKRTTQEWIRDDGGAYIDMVPVRVGRCTLHRKPLPNEARNAAYIQDQCDADFLAKAADYIRTLLAEVDRLSKERDALRTEVERMFSHFPENGKTVMPTETSEKEGYNHPTTDVPKGA